MKRTGNERPLLLVDTIKLKQYKNKGLSVVLYAGIIIASIFMIDLILDNSVKAEKMGYPWTCLVASGS
jgi:hypothetical protein